MRVRVSSRMRETPPSRVQRLIFGQPSWMLATARVEAFVTSLGGHLAPVRFRIGRRTVQPFAVAPWAEESLPRESPNLLRALRGDFFCAPFGANGTSWRGERHPPHGETANRPWTLHSIARSGAHVTLHARMRTATRKGRVDKYVTLVEGHTAIYSRHVLSGMHGPMSVGHHALVQFPNKPASGIVSSSPFIRGQVLPGPFEEPEKAGYQSLRPGATFRSLARVPLLTGHYADLSVFPARKGFDDLVMLTASPKLPFAWTAVTFAKHGYVWLALRDPRVLRHTVLWMSNGGRHYPPWNGRHTGVMGIEDVTAYFHYGLAESAGPNPLSAGKIPTALILDARSPTTINTIMAVAALPRGFDRVADVKQSEDGVDLISPRGVRLHMPLDLQHLFGSSSHQSEPMRSRVQMESQ